MTILAMFIVSGFGVGFMAAVFVRIAKPTK